MLSYLVWPWELVGYEAWAAFVAWLAIVVGLVALTLYDFKHLILPDRIVFPLMAVAVAMKVFLDTSLGIEAEETVRELVFGVLVGGGFFYALFQVSGGKWIGGGDVKLGFLIGLALGPANAAVALISAFYIAAFILLPLMVTKKVTRKSKIPFGPFLILGFVLAMLWGENVREFYTSLTGL